MNINKVIETLLSRQLIQIDSKGFIHTTDKSSPYSSISINGYQTSLRRWAYYCLYGSFPSKQCRAFNNLSAIDPRLI